MNTAGHAVDVTAPTAIGILTARHAGDPPVTMPLAGDCSTTAGESYGDRAGRWEHRTSLHTS